MRVALVLGSGGARGFAHIGVIDELEARGHEVVCVAGSSMGALVGGVYCAGKLPELTTEALDFSRLDLMRMVDFTPGKPGIIGLRRVIAMLRDLLGTDPRIEDLQIPFTAVAADLINRREVWFTRGPLLAAIRASISIPTLFAPVQIADRLLVDGGVLNPLPIEATRRQPSDVTVAVSLFGRSGDLFATESPESADDIADKSWTQRMVHEVRELPIARKLAHVLPGGGDAHPQLADSEQLDLFSMTSLSLDVMQATIEQARLGINPPDVLITVPQAEAQALEFDQAERLIEFGRLEAIRVFDTVGL